MLENKKDTRVNNAKQIGEVLEIDLKIEQAIIDRAVFATEILFTLKTTISI